MKRFLLSIWNYLHVPGVFIPLLLIVARNNPGQPGLCHHLFCWFHKIKTSTTTNFRYLRHPSVEKRQKCRLIFMLLIMNSTRQGQESINKSNSQCTRAKHARKTKLGDSYFHSEPLLCLRFQWRPCYMSMLPNINIVQTSFYIHCSVIEKNSKMLLPGMYGPLLILWLKWYK